MVETQIRARGITDQRVIKAMEKIPRISCRRGAGRSGIQRQPSPHRQPADHLPTLHRFPDVRGDGTDWKGEGARDRHRLRLSDRDPRRTRRAGIFDRAVRRTRRKARKILDALNYFNVAIRVGDGTYGWREEAPFDAITVTAGAPRVPAVLVEQLAVGGRLVIPVGSRSSQTLLKVIRMSEDPNDVKREDLGGVRFVDLVGEHGWNNS